MATIKAVAVQLNDDAVRVTWSAILAGDDCESYAGISEYDDRSIQFRGTFGGGTIAFTGTDDEVEYETLNDTFGVAVSYGVKKLRQILEYVYAVKPALTGGDGTTSITATLVAKRKRR